MANNSSATTRGETPHANRPSSTNTIMNALKRRAQAVLNDQTIDPQSRAIIRYALERNDPWLARLVRNVDSSENEVIESEASDGADGVDTSRHKIETLAEIICRAGDEASAALFVLMGRLQTSGEPRVIANTAKHFAFTRCAELNFYGIVDAQIAVVERELLARNP